MQWSRARWNYWDVPKLQIYYKSQKKIPCVEVALVCKNTFYTVLVIPLYSSCEHVEDTNSLYHAELDLALAILPTALICCEFSRMFMV